MAMLLDDNMPPREAWQQIHGALVNDGMEQDCAPLMDWLRVAITRRATNQGSILAQASPAAQVIATVNDATTFQEYRMGILE
jgi:hypothetical protein